MRRCSAFILISEKIQIKILQSDTVKVGLTPPDLIQDVYAAEESFSSVCRPLHLFMGQIKNKKLEENKSEIIKESLRHWEV